MVAPIDFYFDFSSPYGYLASYRVDEIAAEFGRAVAWRPYLLGVAFKNTGQSPHGCAPRPRLRLRAAPSARLSSSSTASRSGVMIGWTKCASGSGPAAGDKKDSGWTTQALERQSGPDLLPRAVHLLFDNAFAEVSMRRKCLPLRAAATRLMICRFPQAWLLATRGSLLQARLTKLAPANPVCPIGANQGLP